MEHVRPPRMRLLGAEVDLVTPGQMLSAVDGFVTAGKPAIVANHNAHSLYLLRRSPALRAFFNQADLIEIDSVPMIAWGRALGLPLAWSHRCTYLDWRDGFWDRAQARGWRVFHVGGAPGVPEAARAAILARWPEVKLDVHHGYFDATPRSAENRALLARIADFEADIIFVGMGMPRQEEWILANRAALSRGVMFSIGAAFDYEAGVQAAAPRWMATLAIEWLFRLATQPRRLAPRYLVEPWFLLPAALQDLRDLRQARREANRRLAA